MKSGFIFIFILLLISCDDKKLNSDIDENVHSVLGEFSPILPINEDNVVLPKGFSYQLLVSYRDPINNRGDLFGFNNDHIEFFPIEKDNDKGMLFVSHESFPSFKNIKKIPSFQKLEKYMVGASIFKIIKTKGDWKIDYNYPLNRRYTAESKINVDGPAKRVIGEEVIGTMSNCSGGSTLWNTVLSGEEYLDYASRRKWKNFDERSIGWIVEFDPFDSKNKPIKHTALGRMKHENAVMTLAETGQVVVYMGDDSNFGSFYKFVSSDKYIKGDKSHNQKLLSEGTLFGAKLAGEDLNETYGEWIPIDINHPVYGKILRDSGFKDQADVLINCQDAARFLGLAQLDRPEDCEIHPDGSIYLALSNNFAKPLPNFHGKIVRFVENNNDPLSVNFKYEVFLEGGQETGFSSPDNMAIDSRGNIWLCSDISGSKLNRGEWKGFGNNGLYYIITKGKDKGKVYQFASGPAGSELTGPWFSPDESELFLSVQHPGTKHEESHWPTGKESKPSVIVIRKDGIR